MHDFSMSNFRMTILAHYNGSWAYPFLDILSWPGRIVFFVISGLLMVGFYFLGAHVNKLFWGEICVVSKFLTFILCHV